MTNGTDDDDDADPERANDLPFLGVVVSWVWDVLRAGERDK